MQVITRQMGGLGGKQGGLQDMIKEATAENIPGPDWVLNRGIVDYINRSPNRGSEKAFKYLKARFTQSHVKVQNLTLLVLETCMKNCGHMFREKLPFSEMWEELHKVAILKRKADTQIYNKVLSLIEDWSDAIGLPAYRQEFGMLKTGAARFPVRPERDLSGYVPDGQHGGIPTQLVIPPGTSDEDRAAIEQAQAELNGPRPGALPQHSPKGPPPPYTYGGDGHFVPPPQAAAAGKPDNAAQLPGNHLASGQSATKLKEDLFSAANSIELFKEMLAPITPQGAADVKQEFVKEQAEQCAEMLVRLGVLAESESDEATLQQTLELHSAVEAAMEQYNTLLAVAEGRASPESVLHEESASVSAAPTAGGPSKVAPKPSLNLLDFYDDSPLQQALESAGIGADASSPAQPEPAAAAAGAVAAAPAPRAQPVAASAAPPKPRSLAEDILGDLYAPVPVSAGAGPGVASAASDWGAAAVRGPQSNNPFAAADVPETAPMDGFGDSAFADSAFGEPAFGAMSGAGISGPEAPPVDKLSAVPSPVNLSPQSGYPGPLPGGPPAGAPPPAPVAARPQPHAAPQQQHGHPQPYAQMQQFGAPQYGQPQFSQPQQFGQQPQYGGQPQYGLPFGAPPPSGAFQQQQQGFYAMPLSLPPAPGYAPQSQDLSQDMLSDAAFGAPQQQMGGHMPGGIFSPAGQGPPNPWGAPPAFGPPSTGAAQAGSKPWGAPNGALSPGSQHENGASFGANPAPAWLQQPQQPQKESDPFGDLVSLRK